MHTRTTAALLIALAIGLVLATPATASPPGFGGEGGGTITIDLPGRTIETSGKVYDDNGALANVKVTWYRGDDAVGYTFTDNDGHYALTPPGFGGEGGGTIAIDLPGDVESAGGTAYGNHGDPLSGVSVTWWLLGEQLVTDTTSTAGEYLLVPPGFGGEGGGTT